FRWHAARRCLRSFPTRRSSDLELRRLAMHPILALPGAGRRLRRLRQGIDRLDDLLLLTLAARRRLVRAVAATKREAGLAGQDPRDRKSTRLNSSHVKISYAVFC